MPILGLYANRLAANVKYSVLNSYKLTIPIQMQLPQKKKNFLDFFSAFLNSSLNFKHFEKKGNPHKVCISENTDCENVVT